MKIKKRLIEFKNTVLLNLVLFYMSNIILKEIIKECPSIQEEINRAWRMIVVGAFVFSLLLYVLYTRIIVLP